MEVNGVFELFGVTPVKIQTAVKQIVVRLVSDGDLERRARLQGVGGPESPPTHNAVQPCIAIQEHFALTERKIIGADNVDDMVDV